MCAVMVLASLLSELPGPAVVLHKKSSVQHLIRLPCSMANSDLSAVFEHELGSLMVYSLSEAP